MSGRPTNGHRPRYARGPGGWSVVCVCAWLGAAATRREVRASYAAHRASSPRRCRECGTTSDLIPGRRAGHLCRACGARRTQEWATANPEAYERRRRAHQLRQYGLTPEDYDALLLEQGGVCRICTVVPDGLLDVDHDHTTGAVRGLLCRRCNRGIGLWRDDAELLTRAAAYLNRAMVPA